MVLINFFNLLFLTFYKKKICTAPLKILHNFCWYSHKRVSETTSTHVNGFPKNAENFTQRNLQKKLLTPVCFLETILYRCQWLSETFYERASAF